MKVRTMLLLAIGPALGLITPVEGLENILEIGSRLELMLDEHLIDRLSGGAALRLHKPTPREVAIVHDEPWEGNSCGYHAVFQDGELYRMYYKTASQELVGEPPSHKPLVGYAESRDGIHWTKPKLGLFEFEGSSANNIVWDGSGLEAMTTVGFAPFKDTNPDTKPGERYKAMVGDPRKSEVAGMYAFKSSDGLRWEPMSEKPVLLPTIRKPLRLAERCLLGQREGALPLFSTSHAGRKAGHRGVPIVGLPPLERSRLDRVPRGSQRAALHQSDSSLL